MPTAGEILPPHRVRAHNAATASENKIHDDTVARRHGFAGGLVPNARKMFAWISLVLVIVYIGVRFELHEMASSRLEELVAKTPGADKWAAFPQMLNPFMWDGIVQTKTQLFKLNVHATEGVGKELARIERGAATDIVKQAAQAESADVLLRFARFLAVRVEGMQFGKIFAGAAKGREGQSTGEVVEDIGRVVAQEHLAGAALPANVVHIIDIADEVGFLEADDEAIFVGAAHKALSN